MYAICEVKGKQYKVEEGNRIRVEKLNVEIGDEVKIGKVLLISKDEEVIVGQPNLEAEVRAEVLNHQRDKKITVIKFKKRKGYKRKIGHRQSYTELLIKSISLN